MTDEAVPVPHKFAVGAALTAVEFAEPHTPLTAGGSRGAWQDAVVPPLVPEHVQSQGPVPLTDDALPTLHRFAVGVLLTAVALAEPQLPLSACGGGVVSEEGEDDPPQPARSNNAIARSDGRRSGFIA